MITEVPLLVGTALVIALILKTFFAQAFSIPSGSMEQTIRIGDRVVVDKLTPWFGAQPDRGDVVVFRDPGGWLAGENVSGSSSVLAGKVKDVFTFIGLLPSADEQDLIKRVIGVGGDTVACCDKNGRITVNGTAVNEPYLYPSNPPSQMRFSVKVPSGRLWVMGDHRSNSADSRYHLNDPGHGTIPEDDVIGTAFAVAWPIGHWSGLNQGKAFASVPDGTAAAQSATIDPGQAGALPLPVELPLVMTVVGLLPRARGNERRDRGGSGGRFPFRIR